MIYMRVRVRVSVCGQHRKRRCTTLFQKKNLCLKIHGVAVPLVPIERGKCVRCMIIWQYQTKQQTMTSSNANVVVSISKALKNVE